MEGNLDELVGGILLSRAGLENPGGLPTTGAIRSGLALIIQDVRDCSTKELLVKIEALLPNMAASSLGLRALRDRLTTQISEAKELPSRFPDSFLGGGVSAALGEPSTSTETKAKP